MSARDLRLAVALSFPIAFAVHDAEEVLAAADWQRRAPALLRARFPRVTDRVVDAVAVSPRRMKDAVAVVSCAVAAVTAVSLKQLDGPPRLLRSAVAVFGAHSITHLLQAVVLRSYTPGVATAVAVVAPYSAWAWRALNKADPGSIPRLVPTVLKAAPAVLLLAFLAQWSAARRATHGLRKSASNPESEPEPTGSARGGPLRASRSSKVPASWQG